MLIKILIMWRGNLLWKLRPDLKSALEQMDLTEYPLYETENSNIRFWVFNHTWTDASDENVKDLVNQALENNYAFMQYEYKYQDSKRVTENYRMAAEIKSGDYVFLRGKNHIYAYGKVITPRLNATQLLNLRKIINENSCPCFSSESTNEVIAFDDNDVFYMNLTEGKENWGQRIDVEKWMYNDKSPLNKTLDYIKGSPYSAIREIDYKTANELIISLGGKLVMRKSFEKYINLLRLKKNIILQGAPGTGKTYSTASIALGLIGEELDYSDHGAVMQKYQEYVDSGRISFVTFHQSLDYEDFVEGIKPKSENGAITYEVEDGIFKKICGKASVKEGADITKCIDTYLQSIKGFENRKLIPTVTGRSQLYVWWNEGNTTVSTRSLLSESEREPEHTPSPLNIEKIKLQAIGEGEENNWRQYAQAFINAVKKEYADELENKESDKPYILIIDEINRGNVLKIFGELITLLEADKRLGKNHAIEVTLPYSKEKFSVPQNLYIIGTMNTTDRSVGNIDYAVRRRFAFVTLKADKSVIENHYKSDAELKEKAAALFDKIEEFLKNHKTDISIDDLMPGHSYFMAETKEELSLKLEYELIPLVSEYAKDGIISAADYELSDGFEQWKQILL